MLPKSPLAFPTVVKGCVISIPHFCILSDIVQLIPIRNMNEIFDVGRQVTNNQCVAYVMAVQPAWSYS